MKRKLLVSSLFVLLVGCSSELSFSEIKLENVKNDARTFFEGAEDTNGSHLYFDEKKVAYVMLNGKNVIQGDKAIHFSDFSVESDGGSLNIHYTEEETNNYSDDTQKHQVVYKINKNKEYDTVRIFKNGDEVPFQIVSGN